MNQPNDIHISPIRNSDIGLLTLHSWATQENFPPSPEELEQVFHDFIRDGVLIPLELVQRVVEKERDFWKRRGVEDGSIRGFSEEIMRRYDDLIRKYSTASNDILDIQE